MHILEMLRSDNVHSQLNKSQSKASYKHITHLSLRERRPSSPNVTVRRVTVGDEMCVIRIAPRKLYCKVQTVREISCGALNPLSTQVNSPSVTRPF